MHALCVDNKRLTAVTKCKSHMMSLHGKSYVVYTYKCSSGFRPRCAPPFLYSITRNWSLCVPTSQLRCSSINNRKRKSVKNLNLWKNSERRIKTTELPPKIFLFSYRCTSAKMDFSWMQYCFTLYRLMGGKSPVM
jgi:hypothetical protein